MSKKNSRLLIRQKILNISFTIILVFLISANINLKAQDTISPPNPDGPTKVYINMVVYNISSIDAINQTIKAGLFLTAKWKDPRLAHNSKGRIVRSLDRIWDPWLNISNKLSSSKSMSDVATILEDGTVFCIQNIYGEFLQDFQFRDFPFDKQNFHVRLTAIGFSVDEVELVYEDSPTNDVSLKLPDWSISNFRAMNEPYTYSGDINPVPSIKILYDAKREPGFYMLVFVIPLVLIIVMSWMAFWLDPSMSSSQISIATTSMLTLIAYRFVVIGNLPKISYMTKMDVFILGSSLLIFLTLLETAITASIYSKGNKTLPVKLDNASRWIFPLLYAIIAVIAYYY